MKLEPSRFPRGLRGRVQAMARPRCDPVEREAVRALAKGEAGGNRTVARILANAAVKSFLEVDQLSEPVSRDLLHAEKIVANDRHYAIAMADGGAADLFFRLRLERFEKRDCRQLRPAEWDIETKELSAIVADRLARRFRNYLQGWP